MGMDTFAYKLFFLLHITCAIVGFGSTFVWAALGARARSAEPSVALAMNQSTLALSKRLTSPFIYATAAFGIVLVILSDKIFKFSQAWVSIAFVLFIVGVLLATLVQAPTHKKMVALQEELVSAGPGTGGPPPQVAGIQAAGKKMAMTGGILHLVFLLLMIDMIWKPGF